MRLEVIVEVTEGWGGRNGKLLFNGTEFVWDDEVVLEMKRDGTSPGGSVVGNLPAEHAGDTGFIP